MIGQSRKRFWTHATVRPSGGGFAVFLDARVLRTPAKAELTVPARALAEALAAEWLAVGGQVDPEAMPMTRSANAAIDKVAGQHRDVAANLSGYGGTDLLCYRAGRPAELRASQEAAWGPWLVWAEAKLNAPLTVYCGVMHGPQPPISLSRMAAAVDAFDAFELTALHDLVAISGSLVLGLAVAAGDLEAGTAFDLSRVDEIWQADQWGFDEEAEAAAALKRESCLNAARFLQLVRSKG